MDTSPLIDPASQPKSEHETLQGEPSSTQAQGLSKNAQKRAAKAARLHELKLERRAREKEARKRKRRERAQAIANGELDENLSRKRRRTIAAGEQTLFDAKVVIDLGFDELMTDKEINSLTSQLAYTYSANRHAAHSFSALIFTSLNGRTKQRLDAMNDAGYRRWSRTEWWEEGYDQLWTDSSRPSQVPAGQLAPQDELGPSPPAIREDVVYLTADSTEELLELREGETYVIGGICDHNRYKNLCYNKATDSRIRHARLPIGRYIALATRKVLTVNQAFEILLKWIETRDWERAFWDVIPKRKFQGGHQDKDSDDVHDNIHDEEGMDHGGSGAERDDSGDEGLHAIYASQREISQEGRNEDLEKEAAPMSSAGGEIEGDPIELDKGSNKISPVS